VKIPNREANPMKRSMIAGVAVACFLLASATIAVSNAAAQGKPTEEQLKSIQVAWGNLKQATNDLVGTAPDVKGDTSKLEGHLKAATNDLHLLDTARFPAPRWYPGYDRSRAREAIFNAVQGHLDAAQKALEQSGAKDENVDHALAEIKEAGAELNIDRNTPVAAPAKSTAKPK
jgi:hypothetical protein